MRRSEPEHWKYNLISKIKILPYLSDSKALPIQHHQEQLKIIAAFLLCSYIGLTQLWVFLLYILENRLLVV